MRGILIPADDTQLMQEVQFGDDHNTQLNQVRTLFPSGMPEIVRTRALHALMWTPSSVNWTRYPTVVMLVDDEGHHLRLPQNNRASTFYDGVIVGDALLLAEVEVDGAGDLAALPDAITIDKVASAIVDAVASGAGDPPTTVGQDVEPV
jgi:hypothetical protein